LNFDIKIKERNGMLYAHYYEGDKLIKRSLKLKATKPNIAFATRQIIPNLQVKLAKGEKLFQEIKISVFFDKILKRYELTSPSTYASYSRGLRNFLNYFGDVDITKISVLDIDGYIEHLHKTISGKTIRLYLAPLSLSFNEAIRLDIIQKNPVRYAIKPKIETVERRAYTIIQMWRLLDSANGRLKTFLYFGFLSGMRAGEILGLNWSDIDLEKNTINVSKSLGQFGMGKTKSRKDRRIPLIKKLSDYLQTCDNRNGFVIGCTRATITADFKKLCNALGFFYEGTHNLRHTFASLMLQARENPLLVKEFLGHANLSMINTVYAHYIQDMDDCSKFGAILEQRA